MVAGAAVAQTEIVEAVDRLSKLILDAYVETDNDVGPRVAAFKEYEEQLSLLGAELNRLRDGCSAAHAAHLQLAQLSSLGTGPSVARSFGKRQEGLAQRSQSMAAQYERFVTTTVNQLEGLSLVVANKYKLYCNKVIEIRRRKAQLQLLVKQKERADLRSLERTLIPTAAGAFDVDTEGTLWKCSSTTKLWWSCYARLDSKRKVLLLSKSQADTPTAATKAVALSKYVLCHELPEHYVKRAAAFELVPVDRDLPVIVLAADGTMASRSGCAPSRNHRLHHRRRGGGRRRRRAARRRGERRRRRRRAVDAAAAAAEGGSSGDGDARALDGLPREVNAGAAQAARRADRPTRRLLVGKGARRTEAPS